MKLLDREKFRSYIQILLRGSSNIFRQLGICIYKIASISENVCYLCNTVFFVKQ